MGENLIGERINIMRNARGYTIKDLSVKTDLKEPAISAIEHGKKGVGLKSLITIADALNCSLDYLTGRSEEPFISRRSKSSEEGADCGYPQSDEELKRERFLAEMGEVFDKYMKADADMTTVDNESPARGEAGSLEQERSAAVEALKQCIRAGQSWHEALWNCVREWQGVEFKTVGRGRNHTGSTAFTYELKRSSRTGKETSELIISTREAGKTITRSSVELALSRFLSIQQDAGFVKGPKAAGQIFGGSYLYAVFVAWGVISSSPDVSVDI